MDRMARRGVRAAALATSIALVAAAVVGGTVWATVRTRQLRAELGESRAAADAEVAGRIAVAAELETTRVRLLETGRDLQAELARIDELDSGVDATVDRAPVRPRRRWRSSPRSSARRPMRWP